jgi:putative aminopeptidase FrvX
VKPDSIELIRELSQANGAPGFEDEVNQIIRRFSGDFCSLEEDNLRNLYLSRQGERAGGPAVMIEAHSDEVAFMVQSINPNGALRLVPLGSWLPATVLAQRVRVLSSRGQYLPGVVAAKPPHFLDPGQRDQAVKLKDMTIDLGATSRQEVTERLGIEPGAPVLPESSFHFDSEREVILGKALDNRLGCAAVAETMQALQGLDLKVRPAGVISTQEEVGARGVQVAVRWVQPQAAVIYEGTPADDTLMEDWAIQGGMGRGPQIRHLDPSMITNPRFLAFARQVAQDNKIEFQDAVRTGGATDGAKINLANQGVPAIVIGIPIRYAHSPHCFASLKDYRAAVRWGVEILKKLDQETLEGF